MKEFQLLGRPEEENEDTDYGIFIYGGSRYIFVCFFEYLKQERRFAF